MKVPSFPPPTAFKPPRPPNAWIIFRSEMMKTLPKVPGQSQADVSRIISKMWKEASDETRQQFERKADAFKAEHQRMYPGYRFQPVKREEKERQKEEKRLEKEKLRAQSRRHRRHAPYASSQVAAHPPLPPHSLSTYPPAAQYGTTGPSPPISAASSPSEGSPFSDSSPTLNTSPSVQSSNNASPGSTHITIATTTTQADHPPATAPPQPLTAPPPIHQWPISQTPQNINPVSNSDTALNVAPNVASIEVPTWLSNDFPGLFDAVDETSRAVICPDIPLQGWPQSEVDNLSSLQACINPTDHADIFNFFGLGPENIQQGFDLTASMGEHLPSFLGAPEQTEGITGDDIFDLGLHEDSTMSSQSVEGISWSPPKVNGERCQDSLPWPTSAQTVADNAHALASQRGFHPGSDMMQYLDFETINTQNSDLPRFPPIPLPLIESNNIALPTNHHHSTYLPPSGAAKAGARRVAGSWKHTYLNNSDTITS